MNIDGDSYLVYSHSSVLDTPRLETTVYFWIYTFG